MRSAETDEDAVEPNDDESTADSSPRRGEEHIENSRSKALAELQLTRLELERERQARDQLRAEVSLTKRQAKAELEASQAELSRERDARAAAEALLKDRIAELEEQHQKVDSLEEQRKKADAELRTAEETLEWQRQVAFDEQRKEDRQREKLVGFLLDSELRRKDLESKLAKQRPHRSPAEQLAKHLSATSACENLPSPMASALDLGLHQNVAHSCGKKCILM